MKTWVVAPQDHQASTEPGPDDPGDLFERLPVAAAVAHASTEPGPDDPGDEREYSDTLLTFLLLQRSRGRMTPVTCRNSESTAASSRLQRSRGRMTPVTWLKSWRIDGEPWLLQRSRGRMTPVTARR